MRILIKQPIPVRLDLEPGDVIEVGRPSAATEQLLAGTRLDGERVAVLVDEDETELATTGRGVRRGTRPPAVP